jgi:O-antigen ligase
MLANGREYSRWRLLASKQVLLVSLFILTIAASTILGVAPVASLFGSSYNQMGLITYLCFFILFLSLILKNGQSETRFRRTLWSMLLTGLAVATYAFMQFFDRDPFLRPQFYTFESPVGPILRVHSTIGHSDYLGNFLLYVTPLGLGLALSARGSARRIGFMAAGLSSAAILFTGTRGAWVGLMAAALTFVFLTKSRAVAAIRNPAQHRQMVRWARVLFVIVILLSVSVAFAPASRSIVQRARSFLNENTGSGRTLLWRDSMRMVKEYAVVGCGPEGFRKAFLPYKSTSLARHAPTTNNESSHNSYIDAAVSHGLPGAILYVAILASSFSLLITKRRRTTESGKRIILESLVSSLAGVVVHNFFIFDQISTGLYFFAYAALAQISSVATSNPSSKAGGNSANRVEHVHTSQVSAAKSSTASHTQHQELAEESKTGRRLAGYLVAAGCALFFLAAWYCIRAVQADLEIRKAVSAAGNGDLSGVIAHGNRAINGPDPVGDYHFMVARILTYCADNSRTFSADSRNQAINVAMSHATQSLRHTNTPDSNYALLAYLALQLGHPEEVFAYASQAVRTDPNFSNSHWLMAEAHLARDEPELAAAEAQLALSLNPNSGEARRALKRANGVPPATDKPEKYIRYAQDLAGKGNVEKARRVLLRALRRSGNHCADCHNALASLYETENRYPEAIAEWKAYSLEAPERALAEKIAQRIERLQRQAATAR